MSSLTDDNKQNEEAIAESVMGEILKAAVVSAEAHGKDLITEASASIIGTSEDTLETANEQKEDAGLQHETKTEVCFYSRLAQLHLLTS